MQCARCNSPNAATAKFCAECGAALVVAERDLGERRHLTVFFVDLVGSTALSESWDPEELRELYAQYQSVCADVIGRYEGHVAQYLGDGILAYFGYPKAHEDDALRAVRSGLDILKSVQQITLRGERPRVRIGVHTGLVVVGDVGGGEGRAQLALGETPNIAARVQSEAEPNTMLISDVTRKLVAGHFALEDRGVRALKGISRPMPLFQVLSVSDASSRFEALAASGLAPFVGREKEAALLRASWQQAASGSGRTVVLRGEGGIGKSRLMGVARQTAQDRPHELIQIECSPYQVNSALHPVVEMLGRRFGVDRGSVTSDLVEQLEQFVVQRGQSPEEAVPLLLTLLAVATESPYGSSELQPARRFQRTLELLAALLLRSANGEPVLMMVEDLHWADRSTLDLLGMLVASQADAPLLTVASSRPDGPQIGAGVEHCREVPIVALQPSDTRSLIASVVGTKPLPEELLAQIAQRTGGIPLFVEAVTRTIMEAGVLRELEDRFELTGPLPPGLIPDTIRDSLTTRIDRMGADKSVAQVAAAIGREFSFALLRAVASQPLEGLQRAITRMVELDLVVQTGEANEATYTFKHVLIQDAAYDSMLKSRRREIHTSIARTLEREFPDIADREPATLARHLEEAGFVSEAVGYLTRAGQRSMERGIHVEALGSFAHAIALLDTMPEDAARNRHELEIRTAMAGSIIATQGYCAPAFEENAAQSRRLCARLGDPPELVPTLYNLWVMNLAGSRKGATESCADELTRFVSTLPPNPAFLLSSTFAHATTLFYRGRLEDARAAYHASLKNYTPGMHLSLVRVYGDDHGLFGQVYLEWLELRAGEPDLARETVAQTIALAESFGDPYALALALAFAGLVYHDLGDVDRTWEISERASALCTEQGFWYWNSLASCCRGWVRAVRGEIDEGIAEIRSGLGFADLIGQKLPLTYWKGYLVEALLLAGRYDEGLAVVDEALAWSAANVDCFNEAELLRLRGELLKAKGSATVAESHRCFAQAIEVARASGSTFLELKAAVSAARASGGRDDAALANVQLALEKMQGGADVAVCATAKRLVASRSAVR